MKCISQALVRLFEARRCRSILLLSIILSAGDLLIHADSVSAQIGIVEEEPNVEVGDSSRFMKPAAQGSEDGPQEELLLTDGKQGSLTGILRPGRKHLVSFVAPSDGVIKAILTGDFDTVLRMLDSDKRALIWNDDDPLTGGGSSIESRIKEGEVYYLETSGYDSQSAGDFELKVRVDQVDDRLGTLKVVKLKNGDDPEFAMQVEREKGTEEFWLEVQEAGMYQLNFAPADAESDTIAWILDEDLRLVDMNDDPLDGGTTDARVRFRSERGQRFLVRFGDLERNPVKVNIAIDSIEGGDPVETAFEMEADESGTATYLDEFDAVNSERYARYTAPIEGLVTFVMSGDNEVGMDSYLTVYDSKFRMIDMNDDAFENSVDAAVSINLKKDETVFLRCSTYGEVGEFKLTAALGGLPSPFRDSIRVTLDENVPAIYKSSISDIARMRIYEIEPEFDCDLMVTVRSAMGSSFRPVVQLFDPEHLPVYEVGSDAETTNRVASFRLRVLKGGVYLFKVTGNEDSQGEFTIAAEVEAIVNRWDYPRRIKLKKGDTGIAFGTIDRLGDEVVYSLSSPIDGRMSVMVDPARQSELNPRLQLYDSDRKLIAANQDLHPETTAAGIEWQAEAGKAYYLLVHADFTSLGDYRLQIKNDRLPSPFDMAQEIPWEQVNKFHTEGSLEDGGKSVYFRLTANEDKQLSATFKPQANEAFDTILEIYDSKPELKWQNDDCEFMGTNSGLTFTVQSNETYYFRLRSFGESGRFEFDLFEGTLPSPFDNPTVLQSDFSEPIRIKGEFQSSGQLNAYQLKPAEDIRLRITLRSGEDSGIDTLLYLYDLNRNLVAENDDADIGGLGTDSRIEIDLRKDETYFILTSSYEASVGPYSLTIDSRRVQDSFDDADEIEIGEWLKEEVEAEIPEGGEAVIFRIQPTSNQRFVIRAKAVDFANTDPLLRIYDDSEKLIGENDDADDSTIDSKLELAVEEGKIYYIVVSSLSQLSGEVKLSLEDVED